ncbi:hypothetical protein HK103_007663 [Boothiomyces macroporosus]|uniref:Uncharacterized protein n=1 Tax=Boothiomyces macroporosus TaxID=261099 RepID=A0AAD5Y1A2_9FUNG|nr:hypothetical protein HK103_007663 [Boothiomyces macroporosus]
MEEGIKLFSKIKHSNPRKIYDILITKYSELKLYNEIQILLNELKTVNVEPYKSTLVKSIPAIEPSRGYRQIMKVYSLWLQQNKYKVCSSSEVSLDFGPYKNLSVPQAQLLFSEHPYSPLDIKRAMIYFHSANYQAEICEELYGMTTDKVCTLLMIEMYHILGMHDKKEALYLMTESRYNK